MNIAAAREGKVTEEGREGGKRERERGKEGGEAIFHSGFGKCLHRYPASVPSAPATARLAR